MFVTDASTVRTNVKLLMQSSCPFPGGCQSHATYAAVRLLEVQVLFEPVRQKLKPLDYTHTFLY